MSASAHIVPPPLCAHAACTTAAGSPSSRAQRAVSTCGRESLRRRPTVARLRPGALAFTQNSALPAQRSSFLGGGGPWWRAERPPNMAEVQSVQHLVDEISAAAAAEQLLVLEFFGTWCSACRGLHPLMCQLAGARPDVRFLQVDGDANKALARRMGVTGLPTVAVFAWAEGLVDQRQLPASKVDQLTTVLDRWSVPHCSLGGPPPLPGFEQVKPREKKLAAAA